MYMKYSRKIQARFNPFTFEGESIMALYSIGYVAQHYGVSVSTIRRWEAKGIIPKSIRTLGGHRRFNLSPTEATNEGLHIGYARVSSHDQKADLGRQIERLKAQGCDEVISDIGSSLNCAKPGLRKLLKYLLSGSIRQLTVIHEDRLLRFGVGLIKFICKWTKTDFVVVDPKEVVTFEAELAKDVITLMTVFCARLYSRRARHRKKAEASSNL